MIHSVRSPLSLVAALLCLAGRYATAGAEPTPVKAFVVWTSPSRVYLAAGDSTATANALAPGARLTFIDGKHTIGTGEVTGIVDGELVVATLSSGSFARVKHLDRVRVLAERPPLPHLSTLRIGVPCRSNPLFVLLWKRSAAAEHDYRLDPADVSNTRLVRNPGASPSPPWPDTLNMRPFEDVADEEIAFERGELDLAIFWPGELSTHMREGSPAREAVVAWGALGVLAAQRPAADTASLSVSDSVALAALNQDLFRGDLAPLPTAGTGAPRPASGGPARLFAQGHDTTRFVFESSAPGRLQMAHVLNRGRSPEPTPNGTDGARIVYFDAPPESLATLGASLEARGAFPIGAHVIPLFVVRCPIVCAPSLDPLVAALGPNALLDVMGCGAHKGHRF